MKHPFIILGSAGGVLVLGGLAWVYFFLFYEATPAATRVAENPFVEVDAGSFGTTDEVGRGDQQSDSVTPSAITAVTDRRVAGAVGIEGGVVRFVEAGTGHIYEVAQGMAAQKISNTTYPQTNTAQWSPTGSGVAISYDVDGVMHTAIDFIDSTPEESATSTVSEVVGAIRSIAWREDGLALRFIRATSKGSEGIEYDPVKKTEKILFQIPLRDVAVIWDPTPLIVPRAARSLAGNAYRTDLTSATFGMLALSATAHSGTLLFSGLNGSSLTSWLVKNDITTTLTTPVIPEKCAVIDTGALCASPKRFDPARYPDEWYRGEEVYDDEVLLVNGDTGVSTQISDLATPFRTPLDIIRTEPSHDGALMLSRDGHLVHVAF